MIPALEPFLYIFLLVSAVASLWIKDLLAAIIIQTLYSFWMALIYLSMDAPDVGFTEAVIGAGVSGLFFVVALFRTERRAAD